MMRVLGLVGALVVAFGVAAGCGGGGDSGVREVAPIGGTEAASQTVADEAARDEPVEDAGAALGSTRGSAGVGRAAMSEACERLAEGTLGETGVIYTRDESGEWREANPDEAAAILAACEGGQAAPTQVSVSSGGVIMIDTNPRRVGPPSVLLNGVGGVSFLPPMRLGPQEYRCEIRVTQQQADALAGAFSVRFSGGANGEVAQTVEVEGPSWTGEAVLPAGGEGIREVRVVVESEAADAEWLIVCTQLSG